MSSARTQDRRLPAAHSLLTVRRLRPFARRRLRTRRPFFVLMRTRNPCVRLRWRVLGWNVRFPFMLSISLRSGNEPTMLANAFGRCQSDREMLRYQRRLVCAKVCILQDLFGRPRQETLRRPRQKRDVRLVSSLSFPHLWKKLWKFE